MIRKDKNDKNKEFVNEPPIENIKTISYADEMKSSYIDYATSVIVARTLPDVRDGLKPVQRRTLYDMYELSVKHDKPYKKSARIVGDTMGKYHPHGDSSIYGALVFMSQPWNFRFPMVDGHGNFGSLEGDGAAAMRYTESRLSKLAEDCFLQDLDKNVVDFVPNFDETETEPSVLAAKIPNLLLMGTQGIAVGMASSVPPHNLKQLLDTTIAYIKDPDLSTSSLLDILEGPDFPTGGIISNQSELLEMYETGKGKIRIRGKVEVESTASGKLNLVITEIPFTMIGAIDKFMESVANLVRDKKAPDITDIRNLSGKEGIKIIIELRKGSDPQKNINILYKKAKLEDTFSFNMLAVKNKTPIVFNLKEVFAEYLNFQYEINTRKYTVLLQKEQFKKEIKEGLTKAVNCIDLIIEVLRGSKSRKIAKACFMNGDTDAIVFKTKKSQMEASSFEFTEAQTDAIMQMELQKLIGLEIEILKNELEECIRKIKTYEEILSSKIKMKNEILKELNNIKKEYELPRLTKIEQSEKIILLKEEEQEQEFYAIVDRFGYIKLVDIPTYQRNIDAIKQEFKYHFLVKNTDKIGFFTNTGKIHQIKCKDIPFAKYKEKGIPLENLSNYGSGECILYMSAMETILNSDFLFTTNTGMIKIVPGIEFLSSTKTTAATKLLENSELLSVLKVKSEEECLIVTKNLFYERFKLSEVSKMKKTSVGVRSIKLKDDIIEFVFIGNKDSCFTIGEASFPFSKIKISKRDTSGIKSRL